MEIKYNQKGAARKALVKAISEIVGEDAKYLGAPSFGYEITQDFVVNRDGNLEVSDRADSELVERVIEELYQRDFIAEDADKGEELTAADGDTAPEFGYSIGIEVSDISDKPCTEETMNNLKLLIHSKRALFQKAIGTNSILVVEERDGTVWFDWLEEQPTAEQTEIYTTLFKALYKMAEKAKRVTAKEKDVENEKFAMRTFLNRIGLIGSEYKALRKELLKNLSGNSAHRYGKKEEAAS